MSATRLLLIIEDDEALARTLTRSFRRRDYEVVVAATYDEAAALLETCSPGYAVVDLKLKGSSSGLECVQLLHKHDPEMLRVSILPLKRSNLAPATIWPSRQTPTISRQPLNMWRAVLT